MITKTASFHAHHSPMGSYGTLTCGMFGRTGGLAMESFGPADGNVYAGFVDGNGIIHQLPLIGMEDDEQACYFENDNSSDNSKVQNIPVKDIQRSYNWATDRFETDTFKFEIINPFFSIPDPETSSDEKQRFASCPAGLMKISYDNSSGTENVKMFLAFGLGAKERWRIFESGALTGGSNCDEMAFATKDEAVPFSHWSVVNALSLSENSDPFLLGQTAGLFFNVSAGAKREGLVAYGFYKDGYVTYGKKTKYWYTRYFETIEEVLGYALDNSESYLDEAKKRDVELDNSSLAEAQKFLIAHATRSYYGSTQWLEDNGCPRWVVNEGEFRMMNTFDLTVDMLFFEMRWNPWTVKNVLEQFVREYSYSDQVFSPDSPGEMFEGGISFTHDMGVANHFSPSGRSSYEVKGLDRVCFSYMTCEQLTNWICCAGVYYSKTGDVDFLIKHKKILVACFESLLNRDNPTPAKRDGVMSYESSMTWPGGEITTYDSLDHSLGQARGNIYLAGKIWASYLALNKMFKRVGLNDKSDEAFKFAELCANTLVKAYNETLGFIPAVIGCESKSAIISAIEGLIFPKEMGMDSMISFDGPFGEYLEVLKKHLENILNTEMCLYDDMGWKLSSTADNSWMSKICLCQHIARTVLGVPTDPESDEAHMQWEIIGSKDQACSDQFTSGVVRGSRYYPRIVTNVLWLSE